MAPAIGRSGWIWAACYIALIGLVLWSLISARRWALTELGSAKSIGQWQAWREDVKAQRSGPSPVQRRVPKSDEPPALVLMRDYFAVSLLGAIIFTTVLYWIMVWFVTGMLRPRDSSTAPTLQS